MRAVKNGGRQDIIVKMSAKLLRIPLVAVVLAVLSVSGCASPTVPSNNAPYSQTDLKLGTGLLAENGKVLTVNYTGWYYTAAAVDRKGPEFDSSAASGPFSFTLGGSEVIAGWDRGVVGMRVGGIRRLIVPPSLGYGSARFGPIPPNATLLFDIELLDVQ